MAVIGYLRVSSLKQSIMHQKYEINQYALKNNHTIDRFVEETVSSRKPLKCRLLSTLLEEVSEHDLIIACEISRFGRSLLEVMDILNVCLTKGCRIVTIKENFQLGNDIQSKVLGFAFGLAAEIERQLISQRTKASLENIRASGKKLGRPFGAQNKKLKLSGCDIKIRRLLAEGVSLSGIARRFNVNRTTLTRYIKKRGLNIAA